MHKRIPSKKKKILHMNMERKKAKPKLFESMGLYQGWKYRSIFRVSVNVDTMYLSDSRLTKISEFFCNYWPYFVDILVFY